MPRRDWRVDDTRGVTIVRSEALLRLPGVGHAFSTRVGFGSGEFDLGGHDGGDPAIEQRRRALCVAAGLEGQAPAVLRQVHGRRVVSLSEVDGDSRLCADAVVARRDECARRAPAVRVADCVPVLLADAGGACVGAVHAGWRGVAAGVVVQAVSALVQGGADPGSLVAALGPCIGPCCYRVGPEVFEALSQATGVRPEALGPDGGPPEHIDLRRAIRLQLERAGLGSGAIHAAPWCTACSDELFFSFRRARGPTGRQMGCIGWLSDAGPAAP